MSKTDYSRLKDTKEARRRRQQRRRQSLNEVAGRLGYETWTRLETAVLHGAVLLTTAHVVDLQPHKDYAEDSLQVDISDTDK